MVFWTTKAIGHLRNEVRSCNHRDNLLGPGNASDSWHQAKVADLWDRRFGGLDEAHPPANKKQRRTSSTAVCTRPRSNVLPVCDRPNARPTSLQPVSTVISNHGTIRAPKVVPKVFCNCTVDNLSATSTLSGGVNARHRLEVSHAAWPTWPQLCCGKRQCLLNNHWLAELPHEQREPARQARPAQLQLHFIARQVLNPLRYLQKDSIHPLGRFGELFEQPWRCGNDLQLRTFPNRHAGANAEGPSTVVGAAHLQRIRLSSRHGHWLGAAASHCHTHEETVHIDMKENGTLRGRVCGAAFLMSNLLRNNSSMKCLKRARHETMRLCLSSKNTFLVFWPHTRSRAGNDEKQAEPRQSTHGHHRRGETACDHCRSWRDILHHCRWQAKVQKSCWRWWHGRSAPPSPFARSTPHDAQERAPKNQSIARRTLQNCAQDRLEPKWQQVRDSHARPRPSHPPNTAGLWISHLCALFATKK